MFSSESFGENWTRISILCTTYIHMAMVRLEEAEAMVRLEEAEAMVRLEEAEAMVRLICEVNLAID